MCLAQSDIQVDPETGCSGEGIWVSCSRISTALRTVGVQTQYVMAGI